MRKRTEAREYALQLLYKYDITAEPVTELDLFWVEDKEIAPPVNDFALQLVSGAIKHQEQIDKKISGFAANWELKRMAAVDRNVLRLGAFELLYLEDIPAKVSINEAVDLAKKYSGEEAGKFVNGILDSIKKDCGKS
ncbi:MAG TPA: transcription antitermination factor NusB [Candidatus Omnitrophota bacterium]|nr:transcription antitermination factor NusB [Candidatus Omnitrophota bacterium]